MKFIQIADVHLGASPDAGKTRSAKQRAKELWESFERIVKTCEREKTDLLLIVGDLFHRQPLLRELKEVNAMLGSLSVTKVVLLAGNHDYIKQDSYYRTFVWADNVQMILSDEVEQIVFPELDTLVAGYSYHTREREDRPYIGRKAPGKMKHEIFLLHGGDEKHVPFRREDVEKLGYDYVALGHIHKPHVLLENRMAYCGALEPIDVGDTGAHGYIQGEFTPQGLVTEFIPSAGREYIHLQVELQAGLSQYALRNQVREQMEAVGMENIFKLILTGYRDPDLLFELSDFYDFGNVVEVSDRTRLAYNYQELKEKNADNLLGYLIASLEHHREDSVEYLAMCKGVQALMETRR